VSAWPPPKRTMDPREIVTGDVRDNVTVSNVRHDAFTLTWQHSRQVMVCRFHSTAQDRTLTSRPEWTP